MFTVVKESNVVPLGSFLKIVYELFNQGTLKNQDKFNASNDGATFRKTDDADSLMPKLSVVLAKKATL